MSKNKKRFIPITVSTETYDRLEKLTKIPTLPKKKTHTEYLVWTIVKSDSEIDRDEVIVSLAESQNNWQVSKLKEMGGL